MITLLPHHQQLIDDSAISSEVALARGYWSTTKKAALKDLGFGDAQCRVPALVIPVHSVTGEIALHQIRPDAPRANAAGKAIKYETPRGARMALDAHPSIRQHLGNPNRPLFITEGVRKADSAISHGLCCLALLGVWNYRGTNADGGKVALPEWETITLNEREVFIVFDSDVMLKTGVHAALARLKGFLESRGALVKPIYLEPKMDGSKVGLDDFFATGNTLTSLLALASATLRPAPQPLRSESVHTEVSLVEVIRRTILDNDIKGFDKKRSVADLIRAFFIERGAFYRTSDARLFFFSGGECCLYDLEQRPFTHLLMEASGLSSTETFFHFVFDTLTAHVARQGALVEVHTLSHYDIQSKRLTLSDGGGGVWSREPAGT